MLIGELARRAGIASSAIRFYEERGLLPRAARLSGRRVFDDRAVAHLRVVQLARDAGFTLAEIRRLVTEFGASRWRRLAERKLDEVRAATERLAAMTLLLQKLLTCQCPDIEFCGRVIAKTRPTKKTGAARPVPNPGRRPQSLPK